MVHSMNAQKKLLYGRTGNRCQVYHHSWCYEHNRYGKSVSTKKNDWLSFFHKSVSYCFLPLIQITTSKELFTRFCRPRGQVGQSKLFGIVRKDSVRLVSRCNKTTRNIIRAEEDGGSSLYNGVRYLLILLLIVKHKPTSIYSFQENLFKLNHGQTDQLAETIRIACYGHGNMKMVCP